MDRIDPPSENPHCELSQFDSRMFAPELRLAAFYEHLQSGVIIGKTSLSFEPLMSDSQNIIRVESYESEKLNLSFMETSGFQTLSDEQGPNNDPPVVTVGLVTQGEGEHSTAKGTHAVSRGDIYINSVDSFQAVWSSCRVVRLKFPAANLRSLRSGHEDVVLLTESNPLNQIAKSIFDGIDQAIREGKADYTHQLSSIAEDFFQNVLLAEASRVSKGRHEIIKARACDYILQHLHEPDLDVACIAGHVNASRATLYRIFADKGGVREWINNERLNAARKMLESEKPSTGLIQNVAYYSGFQSSNQLGRAFKKRFGLSPGEYNRRSIQS